MLSEADATSAAPTTSETVAADVPCAACGYDLRGLGSKGRCPECGNDIAASLTLHALMLARRAPPLSMSPVWWVRRQALACGLLVLSPWLTVATLMAQVLSLHRPLWIFIVLWLAHFALMAGALWLLGTTDPTGSGGSAGHGWRRWIPPMLRLAAVATLLLQIFGWGMVSWLIKSNHWAWIQRMTNVETFIASLTTLVALLHLSLLAARADRRRLARAALVLALVMPPIAWAQRLLLPTIRTEPAGEWVLSVFPVFGHVMGWVILPYALIKLPRFDGQVVGWSLLVALSVATWVVVFRIWLAVRLEAGKLRGDRE
jgi:hypothetical protein